LAIPAARIAPAAPGFAARLSFFLAPRRLAAVLLLFAAAACGKKGPPLAPLNLAPEAPSAVTARRLGDTVYVQFTVPGKNVAGSGPFSVDHLEVYAVTLAPGSETPPNRDLLRPAFVVAKIPVRKPVDPDAEVVEGSEEDTRPVPGATAIFVEQVTPALLTPQDVIRPAPASGKSAKTAPAAPAAGTPAAAAAPSGPTVLTRLYSVQGVAANGARGPAGPRVSVPLLAAPGRPRPGATRFDQSSVTITWQPPAAASDEAPGVTYNVYAMTAPATGSGATGAPLTAPVPLNPKPLDETTFAHADAPAGREQCFIVRSVATVGTATIEGDPSEPICVTPTDTFPPAVPTGLAAVSGPGVINLIWDANKDPDLAGYIVLRGEAPGDTLQPLTPQPIRETRYVDRAVQPGVTYVYAVVAIDTAPTPNRSALSNKVQETAR
jgi:predicted small lipoprotein YifL